MSNYQEALAFEAPSASGGKVWIVPNCQEVHWTASGPQRRFIDGSVAYHQLNQPKRQTQLIDQKRKKGYTFLRTVWVNDMGQVADSDPNAADNGSALKREAVPPKPPEPAYSITGATFDF